MSGIHIGSGEASAIKIGGANASAVYAGDTRVWPMKAPTPPSAEYPGSTVNFKHHGHSYGQRDVPRSAVHWDADHMHKITENGTSEYECVSLTDQSFVVDAETTFLADYTIRCRGDNDNASAPVVYINPDTTTSEEVQTRWPMNGETINRYTKRRVAACLIASSATPFSIGDELPEDQALVNAEPRANYTLYQKFIKVVRKTGPGNFGQNEEVEVASWTVTAPNKAGTGSDNGQNSLMRTASGQMYITLPPGTYRAGISTKLPNNSRELTMRTGMEVILDKLVLTAVTEADHV